MSSSKRVFSVRDCASNCGSASLMRALSRRPWYRMVASAPGFRNWRSFSKMSVITHTRLMSAMRYNSVPLSNRCPGEMFRASTKPDSRRVDVDVGRGRAGLVDLLDLQVAHAQAAQRVDRELRVGAPGGPDGRLAEILRLRRQRLVRGDAQQEQPLGVQEVRACSRTRATGLSSRSGRRCSGRDRRSSHRPPR